MAEINRITVFKDETGDSSYALVDSEHRVMVNINQIQSGVFEFGTSGSVTAGSESTVVTYTVPADKIFKFTGWRASGKAHALFRAYVNGAQAFEAQNSVAVPTVRDNLDVGLSLEQSDIVSITVEHFETGKTVDYSGTILGTLEDA